MVAGVMMMKRVMRVAWDLENSRQKNAHQKMVVGHQHKGLGDLMVVEMVVTTGMGMMVVVTTMGVRMTGIESVVGTIVVVVVVVVVVASASAVVFVGVVVASVYTPYIET